MLPAANPCGHIWIKKIAKSFKKPEKPWIFKIRGFLIFAKNLKCFA
jgi:hypothetical protein